MSANRSRIAVLGVVFGWLGSLALAAQVDRAFNLSWDLALWVAWAWLVFVIACAIRENRATAKNESPVTSNTPLGALRAIARVLINLPQIPWHAWVLRRAAQAMGHALPWWKWPATVTAEIHGQSVRLTRPRLAALGEPLRISTSGLPPDVEIEAGGFGQLIAKAMGRRDLATGDAEFDRTFVLEGRRNAVLAALDADTRRALLKLAVRWKVRIAEGWIHLEARRPVGWHGYLLHAVREILAAVRRPAWQRPVFEGLAENALHDPLPGVRLNSLDALAAHRRDGPDVLRAALSDPNADVRLRAAIWLGGEGRPVLLALATNPETDAECAAEAIRKLGAGLSESQGLEILERARRQDSHSVVHAVIEALGVGGSAAAVPSLREVIADHPLDFALKRAAEAAIACIHSRLEGAEAGQLSVPDGSDGGLSLADDETGRLSLDQPSLSEDGQKPRAARAEAAPTREV